VNPTGSWLALAVAVAVASLAALAVLALPGRLRSWAAGAGTALAGAAGVTAGVTALSGRPAVAALPGLLPLSGLEFAADRLSGFFFVVTGAVAVPAGVYAVGYLRHSGTSRAACASLPLFVASMLLVPAAASASTLLLCWELMALTSLLLVLAEHHRRPEVAEAGRWYAVMTHLGFGCILAGLMLAGGGSLTGTRHLSPALAGTAFVACLAGFGSKAGMVPLHAWLPRAHPEAPSHVSALMSAAMVNMGVYGIIRIGFGLLGGGARWWWLVVVLLGAASAVYGILQAAISSDLKRLLGYSTTENMGLVLTGVGAAGLFADAGHRALAALALTAALLHVAGHAAVKTLLFLSAGSVVQRAGTRDLDALGGLRAGMPATTAAFAWGALAASTLPPGTAFTSEWLLLQALVHGLPGGGTAAAVVLPVAVAAVALTAGLAVATFVKAFGTGFLARPRSDGAARATESPFSMLAGMGLAGVASAALALLPGAVLPALGRAAMTVPAITGPAITGPAITGPAITGRGITGPVPVTGLVTLRLAGVAGELSPVLLALALAAVMIAAAGWLRALPARRARRAARLWDCGGGPLTARMEYTATSFAEPLQRVFDDVLAPETDIEITHADEARYLVAAVEYRRRVPDRIEHRLYRPVLGAVQAWGTAGRRLAPGSVNRYLGYGFYAVTALLIVLAVTR
jgi:formate hydrogenlyase subunit 3/multisubunit Na+/H+ antiporter MnhD subunit